MSELATIREAANDLARRLEIAEKAAKTTRGDFVRATLATWDETAKLFPEVTQEHAIAVEWLTKTWTVEELEQPL